MEIREQEEEGDVGRREIVSNLKVWGVGSWDLGLGKGRRERVRVLVQKDSKSLVWQGGGKGGWKGVVWVCDCVIEMNKFVCFVVGWSLWRGCGSSCAVMCGSYRKR